MMPGTRCVVVLTAALSMVAQAATAACYEDVGCTDSSRFDEAKLGRLASCDILFEMRNTVFKERGYCFKTPRAIEMFGNAGCRYDQIASVPLNDIERANVATITRLEASKQCTTNAAVPAGPIGGGSR
jgi:hypothetical protein